MLNDPEIHARLNEKSRKIIEKYPYPVLHAFGVSVLSAIQIAKEDGIEYLSVEDGQNALDGIIAAYLWEKQFKQNDLEEE